MQVIQCPLISYLNQFVTVPCSSREEKQVILLHYLIVIDSVLWPNIQCSWLINFRWFGGRQNRIRRCFCSLTNNLNPSAANQMDNWFSFHFRLNVLYRRSRSMLLRTCLRKSSIRRHELVLCAIPTMIDHSSSIPSRMEYLWATPIENTYNFRSWVIPFAKNQTSWAWNHRMLLFHYRSYGFWPQCFRSASAE